MERGRELGARTAGGLRGTGSTRAAVLGCALLLGLLTARPAAAVDPVRNLDCPGALSVRLDCMDGQSAKAAGPQVMTLDKPVRLDRPAAELGLSGHRETLSKSPLTVQVPAGRTTGRGGTVLLLLAKERRVAPDATITPLDRRTIDAARAAGLCAGDIGPALCETVAQEQSGDELIEASLAGPLDTGDGEDNTALWVLLGVFTALLALIGFLMKAVRRPAHAAGRSPAHAAGRTSLPPAPRRKPAPERGTAPERTARHRADPTQTVALRPQRHGPSDAPYAEELSPLDEDRHTRQLAAPTPYLGELPALPQPKALVRSALHPEGYVEIDRCLYRARWTGGPAFPPPAVGEFVDVRDVSEGVSDGASADVSEEDDATERGTPHLLALPPARTPQHTGDSHDE
ncbi:hypothetical protein G6045_16185 [Streptomyces sp. YC504]|uniref:Uncharacterized protein n=1 Tax=Streptomyces mesophilus TaxID=1775132 RepID=A0A6G4XHZ2_9ACTN|nr:hypothetical protein [Streptomyces mesophilus]NGO77186.1 hypothetical protein [Streptomyces mesophilus]